MRLSESSPVRPAVSTTPSAPIVAPKPKPAAKKPADGFLQTARKAEPAPAPTRAVSRKPVTYRVRPGDTMSGIASKHGLTLSKIAKLNPKIEDLNRIFPGQTIRVGTRRVTTPAGPTPTPDAGPKAALHAGMPNTEGWSQAKRFQLYSDFVNRFGDAQAKKDLAAGKRVILSLRRDTPMTSDRPFLGTFDDRMVVLWKDRSGPHVTELAGNTEPNRKWSIPANQSSKPVGRLADGQTIRYHKTWSSTFGDHLRPSGNPWAQRDADRDYRFEKGERAYNGEWGGQFMYIHRAWDGNTGSQGCQTLDPSHFASFWRALGSQRDFSNVLVNVTKR